MFPRFPNFLSSGVNRQSSDSITVDPEALNPVLDAALRSRRPARLRGGRGCRGPRCVAPGADVEADPNLDAFHPLLETFSACAVIFGTRTLQSPADWLPLRDGKPLFGKLSTADVVQTFVCALKAS